MLDKIWSPVVLVLSVVAIFGIVFNDPAPFWAEITACFVCGAAAGHFGEDVLASYRKRRRRG